MTFFTMPFKWGRENDKKIEPLSQAGDKYSLLQEILELGMTIEELTKKNHHLISSAQEIYGMVSEATESAQCSQGMVDELSKHVLEVMKQMNETSSSLNTAKQLAEKGSASLHTAQEEMEVSNQRVMESIEITSRLQEDIKNLSEMLEAITNIANQTKLLSLNASIEAARAGEAGRGFSVVAQEVGKLAVKSKETVDFVSSTLKQVRHNTSIVITSMADGAKGFQVGMQLINEANKNCGVIVEQVGNSVTAVETAGSSAEALDLGMSGVQYMAQEIREVIEKCSRITEQNTDIIQAQAQSIQSFENQITACQGKLKRYIS
ncbi:methyl-accepting chemotaxis sensory transducer [Desulforamulus reducens MI-1]|uniref:Methyl-accepting chemotaxis sensory transducer n=1 Tax=Desulforamulus reducens (strain ATCC BAA-1160 / DSM 100696 / MI-1) TaxID=349161 RepID=A4J827_DESRM|nr:methyl-accepting chemotaxis protein [Desulforamulus reducens]ABO51230.1 methyl-accepting chemotaxis sensory transducer [Desulforamulus reducens MI-1]